MRKNFPADLEYLWPRQRFECGVEGDRVALLQAGDAAGGRAILWGRATWLILRNALRHRLLRTDDQRRGVLECIARDSEVHGCRRSLEYPTGKIEA